MSQFVAIENYSMIEATEASGWTAGTINEVTVSKLKVNGNKAIIQASCAFTHTTNPNSPSTIVLNPSGSKLKVSGSDLLRVGDSASDAFGNSLSVIGGQTKLKSA